MGHLIWVNSVCLNNQNGEKYNMGIFNLLPFTIINHSNLRKTGWKILSSVINWCKAKDKIYSHSKDLSWQ